MRMNHALPLPFYFHVTVQPSDSLSHFHCRFYTFPLHYLCKWGRIVLKVVKSGVKWCEVVPNSLFVADHAGYSVTGRVIAYVHGRVQSHN